jgi:hypothetical protein
VMAARRGRFAAALELGRIAVAGADAAATDVLAGELRRPGELFWAAVTAGTLALMRGDFAAAEATIARAVEYGAGLEDASLGQFGTNVTVQALLYHREVGRVPAAIPGGIGQLERSLAAHAGGNRTLDQAWRAGAADLLVRLGRRAEAQELFEELQAQGFDGVPLGPQWLCTLVLAADLCAVFDCADGADRLVGLLAPHADRFAVVTFGAGGLGSVAHYLGQLAGVLGDSKEADNQFKAAADAHRRLGAPPLVARTQLEHARVLLRDGRSPERNRALGLLSAAAVTGARLGMAPLLREVEALRSTA